MNLCWLFTYSKIWEFLDTWLIMAKGHNTIFLQKYHHFGAFFVWYLTCYYNISIVIVPTLFNSFVHTIMYLYYILCLFCIKLKTIKPFITLLQLVQLIIGDYFCFRYYVLQRDINKYTIITNLFIGYALILIILFINFFRKSYF